MGLFGFGKKAEARSGGLENPNVPVTSQMLIAQAGHSDWSMATLGAISVDDALGVPSVWAAVNFISGTIAGLPLHVYRKKADGRERISNDLSAVLNENANDETTSFDWLKWSFEQVLTIGRGVTYIERNKAGRVVNLWPIDAAKVTITRNKDRKTTYKVAGMTYSASDIIDIPFMLKSDGLTVRGPIATNGDAIWMAIHAQRHGAKVFKSGGIPPATIVGPFQTAAAAGRAADDIAKVTAQMSADGKSLLPLPLGHEIKPIGIDPEKLQLLELQRFSVEQIARIYNLPPVFLQDLTHGTFSNAEQQDLHFVKHTIKRWVEQAEAEINLKLFGRKSELFAEFSLDGLLRGDLKSRMEAHAVAIQNAIKTPAEVRALENLPKIDGSENLLIQGATVPLSQPLAAPQAVE